MQSRINLGESKFEFDPKINGGEHDGVDPFVLIDGAGGDGTFIQPIFKVTIFVILIFCSM
jgi:hypothetical protein